MTKVGLSIILVFNPVAANTISKFKLMSLLNGYTAINLKLIIETHSFIQTKLVHKYLMKSCIQNNIFI
jgi:hypothetical protein